MGINFTASGYIEVYKDGLFLSRHRQEREAVESILNQDAVGEYEIHPPIIRVSVSKSETPYLTINGAVSGNA
jgi:hypothetical protein